MATNAQIRIVGLELQENVTALKAAVDAIDTVTSAWVLDNVDGSLPTDLAVKQQMAAYNSVSKGALAISDAITAVNLATE